MEGELTVETPEGASPLWQEFGPSRFRRTSSRKKVRTQVATWRESACQASALMATPYSCSKRAAVFGLSQYRRARELRQSWRIRSTTSRMNGSGGSSRPWANARSAISTASWTTRPAHCWREESCLRT